MACGQLNYLRSRVSGFEIFRKGGTLAGDGASLSSSFGAEDAKFGYLRRINIVLPDELDNGRTVLAR